MITKADLPIKAAGLLAVAGADLGGLWLRARVSALRAHVLDGLADGKADCIRITPEMDDITLYGGLDVAASLSSGRRVLSEGVLAAGGQTILTRAERASAAFSARLASRLDKGNVILVAIDEGAEPDETLPNVLSSRLGLYVSLEGLRHEDLAPFPTKAKLDFARSLYANVEISAEIETDIATLASLYQVTNPRAVLHARAATRASAALRGNRVVDDKDVALALALVIAPRGMAPEVADQDDHIEPQPDSPEPSQEQFDDLNTPSDALADTTAEAIEVALPASLATIVGSAPRAAFGSGQGSAQTSYLRGRPLPSRAGALGSGRRIDPVASIRAALPWQRLRTSPAGHRLALRKSDLRLRRYENRKQRVIIFAVDASGSQAVARMAEAKGAVECLLAEAYQNRDEVALIAFRKSNAETLLSPTRALVRARSALSALPGGGGTPLAAGLLAASHLAEHVRKAGATPLVVLLSDGRANVTLSGTGGRARAKEDAETVARFLRGARVDSIVVDTSRRADPGLSELADTMGGRYVALPNADARTLSAVVTGVLDG